MKMYDALYVEL